MTLKGLKTWFLVSLYRLATLESLQTSIAMTPLLKGKEPLRKHKI